MTIAERIERIVDNRVPIYRRDIPEMGIIKDCPTNRGIKELARTALRKRLNDKPELIDIEERELCK